MNYSLTIALFSLATILLVAAGCWELEEPPAWKEGTASDTDTDGDTDGDTDSDTDTDTDTDMDSDADSDTDTETDPCAQVCCYGYPNECDGSFDIWVYDPVGTCNNITGECIYNNEWQPCSSGMCQRGECVDDPCQGVSCYAPPAPYCSVDGKELWHWDGTLPAGEPVEDSGTCKCTYSIVQNPTSCGSGGCLNGKCVDDPCTGVICILPPASYCRSDTILVTYDQPQGGQTPGTCIDDGQCDYQKLKQEIQCDSGCKDGACLP